MQEVTRKISAVMSLPRLMFTNNVTCLLRAVAYNGIPVYSQTGVFWGQVLTRLIETECKKDLDYILTIDYDSWFTFDDIKSLVWQLEQHPEYDAVFPVQIKREDGLLLIGVKPPEGENKTEVQKEYLAKNDIVPVDSGHFGLTVFRKSCFEKIRKPWFIPKPDSYGNWEEGKIDEDVMFWVNFKEAGLNLGLATKVKIGHLQLMVTCPDSLENDWKPIHYNINEVDKQWNTK